MMRATAVLLVVGVVLLSASPLRAQRWGTPPPTPATGACFYERPNFQGQYFCSPLGNVTRRMPAGTEGAVWSIRVLGSAEVTVFSDAALRGESHRFSSNMSDLSRLGWSDRVFSFRVDDRAARPGGSWGGAYGGGNWGGSPGYAGGHDGGSWGGAYGAGAHGGWGGSSSGGRWTYQQAQEIVRRAYRSTLRRDPDPASEGWVTAVMQNNWTQAQVEAELRKSDEYRARQ